MDMHTLLLSIHASYGYGSVEMQWTVNMYVRGVKGPLSLGLDSINFYWKTYDIAQPIEGLSIRLYKSAYTGDNLL